MIARFSDLNESVIVQGNNKLQDFLKKNYPKTIKMRSINTSYLYYILNGVSGCRSVLADGKPGLWFVVQERANNDARMSDALYVAYSKTHKSIPGEKVRNHIQRFWFYPEFDSVSDEICFPFGDWIFVEETEKCRISSDFIRKVMHLAPKKGSVKPFLEKLSLKTWNWTKDCLKEI